MDVLDRDTLLDLARHTSWPSVSIYLPTHRVHTETPQDLIRFKNLLKSAEEALASAGMRAPAVDEILDPARALLADSKYWQHLGDGLAVFTAEGLFRAFRTDKPFAERCRVGHRFLIRPLLGALHVDERFYVLALSKNRVRLLEGTYEGVREVDVAGVPSSLAEALKYDDYERQVQFHTRTPASAAGRGQRQAVFHGHGGVPDVAKDNLYRYFRAIDAGLHDLLRDDTAPLLLAGVEYLLPIYREANTYPHLIDEAMRGNPDELTPAELHAEARRVLEPHFRRRLEADRAEFESLLGTDSTSTDLPSIVRAAHEGRVKTLLVSEHTSRWGTYDPTTGSVEIHDRRLDGDWDLDDLAAAETLLHGGTVHELDEREAVTAAVFRY